MAELVPEKYSDLFKKKAFANLGTLMKDGSPQVTPVWFDYDGKHVRVNSALGRVKDKNIRRDPRVALSLLGDKTSAQGMREYLVVYGNARVTEGGAVPLLHRLAPIYLGPKADYPPASMQNIAGYVTRIAPARFSGIGPWVQKTTD